MNSAKVKELLDRYWNCETSLQEEALLRAYFCGENMAEEFAAYRAVFAYQAEEPQQDILGDDFDQKLLAQLGTPVQVKARKLNLTHRFMPLMRAVAVVVFVFLLGNVLQMPWSTAPAEKTMGDVPSLNEGNSVAQRDSVFTDTLKQSKALPLGSAVDQSMLK